MRFVVEGRGQRVEGRGQGTEGRGHWQHLQGLSWMLCCPLQDQPAPHTKAKNSTTPGPCAGHLQLGAEPQDACGPRGLKATNKVSAPRMQFGGLPGRGVCSRWVQGHTTQRPWGGPATDREMLPSLADLWAGTAEAAAEQRELAGMKNRNSGCAPEVMPRA